MRLFVPIGLSTGIVGAYQGLKVRKEYLQNYQKEEPLPGPHRGVEKKNGFNVETNKTINGNIFDNGIPRIKRLMEKIKLRKLFENQIGDEKAKKPDVTVSIVRRKIKLLVLGDSLASGVGCNSIPVLPQFLAKAISHSLDADVEWISDGKIGATVRSIRNGVLPNIKKSMLSNFSNERCTPVTAEYPASELVVVIICGLNDWREMLENFPFGLGPESFRKDLNKLIDEVKEIGTLTNSSCKVYLPGLPLICTTSDPMCSFRITPLFQIFSAICWLWDSQKLAIATDDCMETTTYIGSPSLDTEYAVPGVGNICSDGIHPTDQGYKWWAMHIAEVICLSIMSG